MGVGVFASVDEAVAQTVRLTDRTPPISENVRQYNKLYSVYRSLYLALQPTFHVLAD